MLKSEIKTRYYIAKDLHAYFRLDTEYIIDAFTGIILVVNEKWYKKHKKQWIRINQVKIQPSDQAKVDAILHEISIIRS